MGSVPQTPIYLPEARNAVKKLPPAIKPSVKHGIERFINHPFDGKELFDELSSFRSIAIGKYRIIYMIIEKQRLIEIYFIGHRRDVYTNFKELLEKINRSSF